MYRKKIQQVLAIYKINCDSTLLTAMDLGMKAKGWDIEEKFVSWMRGFADADNFCAKFRFKPCAPILAMIINRTKGYTAQMHSKKMSFVQKMANELHDMGYFIPGNAVENRSFWLFPMMVNNSVQFVQFMRNQGFFVF